MIVGIVTEIGKDAIQPEDTMIILFGETATDEIKDVAVIQRFEEPISENTLTKEGKIFFDDQAYQVTRLGNLAERNLQSIGHVTLVFAQAPAEDTLENALYLSPEILPEIHVGTKITYQD